MRKAPAQETKEATTQFDLCYCNSVLVVLSAHGSARRNIMFRQNDDDADGLCRQWYGPSGSVMTSPLTVMADEDDEDDNEDGGGGGGAAAANCTWYSDPSA